MKTKTILFIAMILIAGITVTSCNKTEDPGTPAGSNGTMTLKYAGTAWSASLSVQAVNTNGVLSVTGSDSNAKQGALNINNINGTGTYKVGPNGTDPGNMLRWTEGLGQDQSYMANSVIGTGTITVDKLTATEVSGTFSFTGFNTAQTNKSITEGAFSAKF